jgi:hypothetical protein
MKLVVAALILPAAIVLAIAAFETRVFYPLPANGPTRGIVWDGHTFASKTDFARWLRSRGSSYAIWARRHPVRAGIKPKPTPTPQQLAARNVQGKAKAKANAKANAKARAKPRAQTRAMGQKSSRRAGVVLAVALALSILLLGVVLLRRRRWPRPHVSAKQPLEGAVRRGAAVAEGGAQVTLRWAAATAHRSLDLAAIASVSARRRRTEVAWYLATALIAAGIGYVVTVWLNGA